MDQIKPFHFSGEVSSSKSLYNRALVVQSFFPEFQIQGFSSCEDVVHLKNALLNLETGLENHYDCGSGGTTLRFLLARLSRESGEFIVRGSNRLLARPHKPLYESLKSLGCEIQNENSSEIRLISQGWRNEKIKLNLDYSSQFLSALLLSAWQLPFDLTIETGTRNEGASYLEMTIDFLKILGMDIKEEESSLTVFKSQKPNTHMYKVEPDMSSLFSLGAFAFFNGKMRISSFPGSSLQPDFAFLKILEDLGSNVHRKSQEGELVIEKAMNPTARDFNLRKTPDLFPVLSVLLSRVEGQSVLSGLDVLAFKESDRLENTRALLSELGFKCAVQNKKFIIQGKSDFEYPQSPLEFDPDEDHRMAMAAALAKFQGARINIKNREVVDKSFPEFWEITSL